MCTRKTLRRYEGPSCSIDINECVRGTAGCAANAGCINTQGSYRCRCYFGYQGEEVHLLPLYSLLLTTWW